jgi:hypothetical protein
MRLQQFVGVGMLVLLAGLGLLVVGLQYVPHHWRLTAHPRRILDPHLQGSLLGGS